MNLRDWIKNKKNRKIVVGIAVLLVIGGLLLSMTRQIFAMFTKVEFPGGIISETATTRPDIVKPDYLSTAYLCKDASIKIYLPGTADIGNKSARTTYEEISFVLLEKSEDPLRLNRETLPAMVNMPILGYKPIVEFHTGGTGYLYDYVGDFYATTVTTKVSTRNVTTYALCYYVNLSTSKVALYASVEDPKLLERADEILSQMILSMETYHRNEFISEEEKEEIQELAKEEKERVEGDDLLRFDVTVDGDGPHDNAVLVFEWINSKIKPVSIKVTGPNGQEGTLNEEYSVPGHYVFEFGYATAGEYHIVGETKETLKDCEIGVSSWEGYMDVNHYYEDPENIRGHEG